jgi:hypothetical protein
MQTVADRLDAAARSEFHDPERWLRLNHNLDVDPHPNVQSEPPVNSVKDFLSN